MRLIYTVLVAVFLALPAKADGVLRMVSSHFLDYSSSAIATTAPVGEFVKTVDLTCTTNCYVAFALSGQANVAAVDGTTSFYLPADTPRRFVVSGNTTVVVIRVTADGILNVTEMSK